MRADIEKMVRTPGRQENTLRENAKEGSQYRLNERTAIRLPGLRDNNSEIVRATFLSVETGIGIIVNVVTMTVRMDSLTSATGHDSHDIYLAMFVIPMYVNPRY